MSTRVRGQLGIFLSSGISYASATCCGLIGILLVLAVWEDWRVLRKPDLLFGVSNQNVLGVAGVLHLAASVYLFATRQMTSRALVLIWLGLSHFIYRVGMLWLQASIPFPLVHVVARKTGLSSRSVDGCWKYFIAYLIISGVVVLLLGWRRRKQQEAELFVEHWRDMREHGQLHQQTTKTNRGNADECQPDKR